MSKDFNKLCTLDEILDVYKDGIQTNSYCLLIDDVLPLNVGNTSTIGVAIVGKMILGRGE